MTNLLVRTSQSLRDPSSLLAMRWISYQQNFFNYCLFPIRFENDRESEMGEKVRTSNQKSNKKTHTTSKSQKQDQQDAACSSCCLLR